MLVISALKDPARHSLAQEEPTMVQLVSTTLVDALPVMLDITVRIRARQQFTRLPIRALLVTLKTIFAMLDSIVLEAQADLNPLIRLQEDSAQLVVTVKPESLQQLSALLVNTQLTLALSELPTVLIVDLDTTVSQWLVQLTIPRHLVLLAIPALALQLTMFRSSRRPIA